MQHKKYIGFFRNSLAPRSQFVEAESYRVLLPLRLTHGLIGRRGGPRRVRGMAQAVVGCVRLRHFNKFPAEYSVE